MSKIILIAFCIFGISFATLGDPCTTPVAGKYQDASGTCVSCSLITTGTCHATCVSTGNFVAGTGCECAQPKAVTNEVCSFVDGSACLTPVAGKYQKGSTADACTSCNTVTTGTCPATCVSTGKFVAGTGCECAQPKAVTNEICSFVDGSACLTPVAGKYQKGNTADACTSCSTVTTGTCPATCVTTGTFVAGTGCECAQPKTVQNEVCKSVTYTDGSACATPVAGKYQKGTTADNCTACNTVTTGACPATCVTTGTFTDGTTTGCVCASPKAVQNNICSTVTYTDGTACKTPVNGKYQKGTTADNCTSCSTVTTGACPATCVTTGTFTDGTTTGCVCASPKSVVSDVCSDATSSNAMIIAFGSLMAILSLLI